MLGPQSRDSSSESDNDSSSSESEVHAPPAASQGSSSHQGGSSQAGSSQAGSPKKLKLALAEMKILGKINKMLG